MRPRYLVVVLCVLALPAAVVAQPDLDLSVAYTEAYETASVFNVPDGTGRAFTEAFGYGAYEVDASIIVVLIDINGDPIADYPAEDLWLETSDGGLVACPGTLMADASTDIYGMTTFSQPVLGGGHTDPDGGELTHVIVGGAALNCPGMDIQFNSADFDGDLRVDLCDVVTFAALYYGDYAYAADFRWDGAINLSDVTLLAQSFSRQCPGMSPPDGEPLTLDSRLGIYFDTDGDMYCTTAEVGMHGPGFAYLVASDIVTTEGLAGWECSIDVSGPAVVADWGFPGDSINFSSGHFVIGLGTPMPWQPDIVLLDMTIFITDDSQPVTFTISPADPYTVGPYPAYAPPGEICNTTAIWPSCSHSGGAAVINGPCPEPGLLLSADAYEVTLRPDETAAEVLVLTDNGTVGDPVASLLYEVEDPGVSWLVVTPPSGSIDMAGGTAELALDIDATGLAPGLYEHELLIRSNACHLPRAYVTVTLTVHEDWTPIGGPWTLGYVRGVAWGDFDGDGDHDLYLTRGDTPGVANQLVSNEGDDQFADVGFTLLEDGGEGYGAVWGDLDNDGHLDLMLANSLDPNRLYRNLGGASFADADDGPWNNLDDSRGAVWLDHDNDGLLDLFLAQVNDDNLLLANQGDGTFADVSAAPLATAVNCRNAAWGDYDDDGDLDVYLANRDQANCLYRNDGGGAFTDVTAPPLDDPHFGSAATWADVDNDGDLDLYVVNRDHANWLYYNEDGGFVAGDPGQITDPGTGRGAAWGDYDNDGDLDVFLSNDGADRLLRNDGDGIFVDVTPDILQVVDSSRGAAWCDHDDDGDLDLFVASATGGGLLLRNNLDNDHHWLQIDLLGTVSNAPGIGARITVCAGGHVQVCEVASASGFFSQNSLTAEFGLGEAILVASVEVRWPSGIVQAWTDLAVDQRLTLTEVLPGPEITYEAVELAQDAFPAIGVVDHDNLGNNHVRFDMGRNVSPPAHLWNDPGDSLVATFAPSRPDAVLGTPRLRYLRRPNPLFDPYRDAWPDTGFVDGVDLGGGRWAFDLPDSSFLYPGDVLHYHLECTNTEARATGLATAPDDLSRYGRFIHPDSLTYQSLPAPFVMRALPTIHNEWTGDQPPVLWWNDGGDDGEQHWLFAFHNLGLFEGRDFDVFATNDPEAGAGNGLGGRATSLLLAGYETILYCSGDHAQFTLGIGDYDGDASNDVPVLDYWLEQGDHNLLLSGNHVVADLMDAGPVGMSFVDRWFPLIFVDDDITPLIHMQARPHIASLPGNPITDIDEWYLAAGFAGNITFDAIEPFHEGASLAEYLDPDRHGGAYPYTAGFLHEEPTYAAATVCLPYDLRYVSLPSSAVGHWPDANIAVRTHLLADILLYFGHDVPQAPAVEVPVASGFAVTVRPNPLNPATTIGYVLPRDGELAIDFYDVRGRCVRRLVRGVAAAGPGEVRWDGTGDDGRRLASGVYFCRVRGGGEEMIVKVAVVK